MNTLRLVLSILLILSICGLPQVSQADRAYIVLPVQGGSPVVGELKYTGHVLIEMYKTTGLYMVTGKAAELTALSALTKAQTITKVTDVKAEAVDPKPVEEKPVEEVALPKGGDPVATVAPTQWAELDTKIVSTEVTKLNALLSAESTSATKPVVDDKMTYREVLKKMVTNQNYERDYWVKDE